MCPWSTLTRTRDFCQHDRPRIAASAGESLTSIQLASMHAPVTYRAMPDGSWWRGRFKAECD